MSRRLPCAPQHPFSQERQRAEEKRGVEVVLVDEVCPEYDVERRAVVAVGRQLGLVDLGVAGRDLDAPPPDGACISLPSLADGGTHREGLPPLAHRA